MHRLNRRAWCLCTAGASWALMSRSLYGENERTASRWLNAATLGAVEKGLQWLSQRIQDNGSFGAGGYRENVAVCALGGMAFLSSGSTSGRGPYGKAIQQLEGYVLSRCQENGFLSFPSSTSHGPMYDHGFGTLFLAELYGMSPREELRDCLSKAVRLIITSQNKEGGWRYEPRPQDADLSVTICQVMALRAAKNAGLHVPNDTIEKCVDYVKRCQNADGGFVYMASAGGPSAFARSAAGVVALYSAGIYEGDEITRGLAYLNQHVPKSDTVDASPHDMYGHYYAVQAMWQAGEKNWDNWYPAIRDQLLARQKADGSWPDVIANEYGTAMACIILQMPNNFLPIFQR
jgi:Squalene-hopene cyclase C-terminal domain/Prenyltransferase and squalene oxidase repeat